MKSNLKTGRNSNNYTCYFAQCGKAKEGKKMRLQTQL